MCAGRTFLLFRMKFFLLFLLCTWLGSGHVMAQNEAQAADSSKAAQTPDSVAISLLTCSPGSLVYELYGHTALRVREVLPGRYSDWVFNYGTFSFDQPHFVGRFVMGHTDYELSVVPYAIFYDFYAQEGRGITEQRLNLTRREAQALVNALSENLRPEHAVYRYNFFYDNCTTRALSIIASCINGRIEWAQVQADRSLRDMVHEYSSVSPWNKFGQDLFLGREADAPASFKEQSFAPLYAERFMQQATIVAADGSRRPLVARTLTLLPVQAAPAPALPLTPLLAFSLLAVLMAALTVYGLRRGRTLWGVNMLLMALQGTVGCFVAFLFFFSEHPTVGSNLMVLLFNPLPLLLLPWYLKHSVAARRSWVLCVQETMLLLTFLALIGLGGQSFPPETWPIVFALAVRCLSDEIIYRRQRHAPKAVAR